MGFRPAYGSNVTREDNPQEAPARPPLDIEAVRARLQAHGRVGTVVYLEQCDSTNAQAAALPLAAGTWALVVAEEQTAGRGRLNRSWASPPRSGLLFSVALSTPPAPGHLSLLPLLVGLAVAEQSAAQGVPARVKWPNDVIVSDETAAVRKLGGVLLERTAHAVIAGVGINVFSTPSAHDAPEATALADHGLVGQEGMREVLLADSTAAILATWEALQVGDVGRLVATYRDTCATLGRQVRASLPDGSQLVGEAVDIDDTGRLLVLPDTGEHQTAASAVVALSAADIVHLRTA